MSDSVNFVMPFISVGQSQKEITHNEALAMIDILLRGAVDSIETAPPGSPADGKTVLVASSGATGAFAGHENEIAYYLAGALMWQFIAPAEGQPLRVLSDEVDYRWGGTDWIMVAGVTTYTPTSVAVTNVAVTADYLLLVTLNGNLVSVAGKVKVDPTAAGLCEVRIPLPIASAFAAVTDCYGVATSLAGDIGVVSADVTNDAAFLSWTAADLTDHDISFNFTYRLL